LEHLEVFMLLRRNPSRFWSGPDIAAELRIPVSSAAAVLDRLASDNFLDIKISNDLLYQFNPAPPALEAAANGTAEYYLRERIAMTNLVMTGSLGPVCEFAEAFRLKRDERDG
jgi:hypothetical protein